MSQFQRSPFNQPLQQQQTYLQPGTYQQPGPPPVMPLTPTAQPQQSPTKPPTRKPKRSWKPWQLALVWLIVGTIFGYALHTQPSQPTSSTTQSPTTQATAQPTDTPTVGLSPTPTPTLAPTPKPTPPPKWTTVQTFKGTGSKKTGSFTASNDWKILWTCNPASFSIPYNVIIEVHNAADASLLDLPVNTTCKAGNTSDSSEEHQGGSVYLDITSEGDWTIQVQEFE